MAPKTSKQEKERRHSLCREHFGDDWEWGYKPDFYDEFYNLETLKKQPFKLSQCRQFDPKNVKKDPMQRYFHNVSNLYQCNLVEGHWDANSRNRDNLIDDGTCWVRDDDKHCAKHDNTEVIAAKRKNDKGYIWPSSLHKSKKGCIFDDKCEWKEKTYECFSKAAVEDYEKGRIPELPSDWPVSITKTNVQEYLRQYYLGLFDETPQSYMPLFGTGNRCVGVQTLQISQPQTVINSIFKGMAQKTPNDNRGLLIWHSTGSGKCMAKDTPILMHDGSIKKVQDVQIGDCIMGDDSTARRVLNLGTGQDMMYRVKGSEGYEYTVNSEHVLCLKWSERTKPWLWGGKLSHDRVLEIEVRDYLTLPENIKKELKGYVVPVNFEHTDVDKDELQSYGKSVKDGIDRKYLINSSHVRLQLLSAIMVVSSVNESDELAEIDTSLFTPNMIDDVVFLARSLGMVTNVNENKIVVGLSHRCRVMDITVESVGIDNYYGFEIDGNHRYVLGDFTVTHNTCTAAGVMEAFWDTDKEIIFVSSVEALASNPPEAFMKCAQNLFPRFSNMIKNSSPVSGSVHPLVKQAFERRNVRFFTFAQLAHYLLINKPLKVKKELEQQHRELLKNSIVIIDEVHNIFKPLPHQKAEHFALRDFLNDYKNPLTSNMHLAILTATPGDSPEEIVDLINMVRDRRAPPIKVPKNIDDFGAFGKSIMGLVSYFNIGSDLTKYPFVKKLPPHVAPMSMVQYKKYVEAFAAIKPEEKDFDKLVAQDKMDAYYKPARKYSNMLFNFEEGMNIRDFSSKLPILLNQINKYPNEKHYVYSTFFENRGFGGQGILAVAKILEKEGYEKIDFKTARDINQGRLPPLTPGKKRYILAITNELADKKHSVGDNLQELVRLFNLPQNKNGQCIHVFLASQKFNEGVDFKAVRHVHILEPFLSYNKELQTIGRGARYCSHRDLNISTGEWVVNVHKYLADFPVELKYVDIDGMHKRVEDLKKSILETDAKLNDIKGKRGKEFTTIRESSKKELSELRLKMSEVNKEIKEAASIDPKKYFMIDQKIEEEVADRLSAQRFLLYVMKMMAIDCELFQQFHAQSGDKYKCANPAKK